jgi:hypothetical protein
MTTSPQGKPPVIPATLYSGCNTFTANLIANSSQFPPGTVITLPPLANYKTTFLFNIATLARFYLAESMTLNLI